jgi:hypothetical protein
MGSAVAHLVKMQYELCKAWELRPSLLKASHLSVSLAASVILYLSADMFGDADERNQLNMGLYNIRIVDDNFYTLAVEGASITIDKERKTLAIDGHDQVFSYEHAWIENVLLDSGGILPLYDLYGKSMFRAISTKASTKEGKKKAKIPELHSRTDGILAW